MLSISATGDKGVSSGMPRNGAPNRTFGIYKSVCCGSEIVIPDGVVFPDCPNHLNLPTEWKPVAEDKYPHISEYLRKKKDDSAA